MAAPGALEVARGCVRSSRRRFVVYAVFLLIFVFFAATLHDDGFLSHTNLLNIVRQTTPITVMAVAVVFVLSAGEIDLSLSVAACPRWSQRT